MASLNPTRPKTEPLSPVSAKEPVKPTPMVTSTGAAQQPVKRSPAPPPPAGLTQTPPFLTKLYNLVEDSLTNELVSWTENGALSAQSFTVHKPDEFGRDVLPRYFKHNNFSSFVRQLNQYGFHKKDPDRWTFGHDNFRRGRLDLLRLISRRRPKPQPPQAPPPTTPPSRSAPPPQQAVVELGSYGLAGKLDGLKRDKDVLIKELVITRKAEKKLQEKCENLELRVDMLENSTKQMQNFIMHYFSQVLQPYSDEIASRKRKRLPPAPTLDVLDLNGAEKSGPTVGAVSADAAKTIAPPFAPSGLPNPSGVSLEALRQMMQQMQMSQTAPTAPASVAETSARFVAAAPHTPSPKFAPATVQELPLDENGLNGGDATMRAASPPPAASLPPKAAKPKPNGRANPKLSEASATANALSALEDVLMKSATEPSPREGFLNFQDADGMREQGFAFAKEEDQLPSWNDKFLHGTDGADKIASNSKSGVAVQQDRKTETVEAIDEFMDLHDDIDLLPPLTELPEGTDISALVRHIQGFGDQVDGL